VRPTQPVVPKEFDNVGAEIAWSCAPFAHAKSIGGTRDEV
jgi:hypothetical protein